jgi:hypothetical protein
MVSVPIVQVIPSGEIIQMRRLPAGASNKQSRQASTWLTCLLRSALWTFKFSHRLLIDAYKQLTAYSKSSKKQQKIRNLSQAAQSMPTGLLAKF